MLLLKQPTALIGAIKKIDISTNRRDSMLIHSYMTDGFFDFGKALLLSFKHFHGESMPFLFTTRDISEQQIDELYSLYDNLIVHNDKIDMKALGERTGISMESLKRRKWQVEKVYVKKESIIWKQFISVEDRYRESLQDAFNICGDAFIHMDVDSLIINPLDPLFRLVEMNDVSLVFRPNQALRFKIFGCLMGFKFGSNAYDFLHAWRRHIDAVPLVKKPRGYGQTSCWMAYRELQDSAIKWGKIPGRFVHPRRNARALILQGNNGRRKRTVAKQFLELAQC